MLRPRESPTRSPRLARVVLTSAKCQSIYCAWEDVGLARPPEYLPLLQWRQPQGSDLNSTQS